MGRALITLTVIVSVLAVASPAMADHADYYSHWGHGYAPLVSANCGDFTGTFCNYTSTAENTWLNHGYPNGVRGGNAFQGCGQLGGWILDCVVSSTDVHNGCADASAQGCTETWWTADPIQHLDHAYIMICDYCGQFGGGGGRYSVAELQTIVTHEYGHAFGLGHTTAANSVMQAIAIVGSGPVQHDYDALQSMYAWFKDGDVDYAAYNQFTLSANRAYKFVFQSDGNLVLYGPSGALWASNTSGSGANRATMQTDGNLVLYNDSRGIAVCSTGTYSPGAMMFVQDDGNLVLYNTSGQPIWARSWGNTCH